MELEWEDPPVPDTPFFTRDLYDRYSLAPNIRELWAFLQSPVESALCFPSAKQAAKCNDNSCVTEDQSHRDSCDGVDPCADDVAEAEEECKGAKKSRVELKQADVPFPEPRLPYPHLSSLSCDQHKLYLDVLMSKKRRAPPQSLQTQVNNEVMDFMRYLQDVARICADDYNFIPQGAMQYSEDLFKSCLDCIKTIPQIYQIHEMTSLTGGTFNPGLTLTFEKQLLIMGNVDITDHKIVPADAQLASDYQSVSSVNPPAKKAKDMHAMISSDNNAEKLCARYEPHVCVTRDALVRLLDNHGPDFREQWEVPVWVKLGGVKGGQKKTVYIDSPLLKTEMTVRDRSHLYHEESLKLSLKKNGSKNVFHLMTELPASEQQSESSQRNVASFENSGIDFDVDLTDLETFGEMTAIKKLQKEQASASESKQAASPRSDKTKMSSERLVNSGSSSQEEMNSSLMDVEDAATEGPTQPAVSDNTAPKVEQRSPDSAQESDEKLALAEDSDDEKLVIDDTTPTKLLSPKTKTSSAHHPPVPGNSASSSHQKVTTPRRQVKRAKESGDQLSEILRMQTAMFHPAKDTAKCGAFSQETNSPSRSMGHSLVKPCVSSYLERNQDGATSAAPHESAPHANIPATEHKKILSKDLQDGMEDEQDYEAPGEGNLLYKLYSLQDLLLMVRSSVPLTHTRKVGSSQNQHVPVHVLPKLEYQLCYGVECLSSSEACQLWTETVLHSSTVSYTAHINAYTSKVALLRKLPDDWKQNISCGFKPSKSLNILHHLLKKLTRLDEGQYLVAHKAGEPFVTLLKAANGKVTRGAYNLQQVHSSVPQPPAGFMPWIPVDPAVVLPFHLKHGRVPCTFPMKPSKAAKGGTSQSSAQGAGQAKNNGKPGGKKKKKKKRSAKRNEFMQKLIQKSV